MTVLDMSALTPPQREVLGQIACGQDVGHHPRVLFALASKGLILGSREQLPGTPPVWVTRWEVLLPVHIQWAQWCAEQPDGEE